ncbi:hypothetical protein UFOVP331_119 [uncultured Caudovirales phage]|uniref:Uncharacterized protein n=1 Tax=uncultured Caudovirales phage TaxID=2100421 RepID=A0A6J5M3V5_9CAUD|nr:hypothetical protein UFOVP331_119 [uncultured Caudovirales phage]
MTKYISLESKEIKKTVFTAFLCGLRGWNPSSLTPEDFDKVVYLGKCCCDGDMFACYIRGAINIYRGIKGDEF